MALTRHRRGRPPLRVHLARALSTAGRLADANQRAKSAPRSRQVGAYMSVAGGS